MSGMDRLTELLPCPFCGGEAYLSDAEAGTGGLSNRARNPRCWQCGVDLGYCDTAVEAAAAWNRRASQAAPAPSDGLREAVPLGLVEALRSGRQADMDGVMVTVSRQACEMAADILAALSVSHAPSDGLREALEECDCCVDGLQADGETPCPYCTKPTIPVADAAEALLEAYKSGAWPVGQGRTLEQVAMIIAALRTALSTPTEERQ